MRMRFSGLGFLFGLRIDRFFVSGAGVLGFGLGLRDTLMRYRVVVCSRPCGG